MIFQSEHFKTIVELRNLNLPIYARSGLIKSFISIAECIQEPGVENQYLDEILQPIANQYRNIMVQPNFNQIYQNEDVKMRVISSLEEIKAAFTGCTPRIAGRVFDVFKDIFTEIQKLLDLYHNYTVRKI